MKKFIIIYLYVIVLITASTQALGGSFNLHESITINKQLILIAPVKKVNFEHKYKEIKQEYNWAQKHPRLIHELFLESNKKMPFAWISERDFIYTLDVNADNAHGRVVDIVNQLQDIQQYISVRIFPKSEQFDEMMQELKICVQLSKNIPSKKDNPKHDIEYTYTYIDSLLLWNYMELLEESIRTTNLGEYQGTLAVKINKLIEDLAGVYVCTISDLYEKQWHKNNKKNIMISSESKASKSDRPTHQRLFGYNGGMIDKNKVICRLQPLGDNTIERGVGIVDKFKKMAKYIGDNNFPVSENFENILKELEQCIAKSQTMLGISRVSVCNHDLDILWSWIELLEESIRTTELNGYKIQLQTQINEIIEDLKCLYPKE